MGTVPAATGPADVPPGEDDVGRRDLILARVVRQNREIKEFFRAKIGTKVEWEKRAMRTRIDEEISSWIRWVLKTLAKVSFNAWRARDASRSESGEDAAALRFWLFFLKDWVLVNDAALEPEPEDFM